jgi:hypothetical protein
MKHTLTFLSRVFELVLVIVGTYIAPAFGVGMATFNPYISVEIAQHPTYAAVMTILCLISVGYYVDWKHKRIQKYSKQG